MADRNRRAAAHRQPPQGSRSSPSSSHLNHHHHHNNSSNHISTASNQGRGHRPNYHVPHSTTGHRRNPSSSMTNTATSTPTSNFHFDASRSFSSSSQPSSQSPARSSSSRRQRDSLVTSGSDGCTSTICYSYLIAIVSSFLVVLGLYLSLTQFKASYLLISLAGLSIETIGACIYCVSNIRSSRQARRKQRPHTTSIVTSSTNNNNLRQLNNTSRNAIECQITSASAQRQDTTPNLETIGALANGSHLSDAATAININEDCSSQQPPTIDTLSVNMQSILDTTQDPSIARFDEAALISVTGNLDPPVASAPPSDQTDFVSPCFDASLEQSIRDNFILPKPASDPANQQDKVNVGDTRPDSSEPTASTSTSIIVDMSPQMSSPTSSESSPGHQRSSTSINSGSALASQSDLNDSSSIPNRDVTVESPRSAGLVATDPNSDVRRKTKVNLRQQQLARPKPNNWRRTVVLGPSGEEEEIEIDEEDLDNMSILPPSYDSIATVAAPTVSASPSSASQPEGERGND